MHFPINTGHAAVRLHHYGRIVVNPGRTTLEQRQDNYHAQLLGQLPESLRGRPGNGFCQIAQAGILLLAKVQAVVQFLQHDQLGPLRCRLAYVLLQAGDIVGNAGGAGLLHHAYLQFSHYLYRLNCLNSLSALILSIIAQTRRKVRESFV